MNDETNDLSDKLSSPHDGQHRDAQELSDKLSAPPPTPPQKQFSGKEFFFFNAEYLVAAAAGVFLGRLAVQHVHTDYLSPGLTLFVGDSIGFYAVNIALRYVEKAKLYRKQDRSFLRDIYKLAVVGSVVGLAATACRVGLTNYLTTEGWSAVTASDAAQVPAQIISFAGFNVGWFRSDRITKYCKSSITGVVLYISEKLSKRPHV
ncbi:hypothetical protein HY772_10045 [Candidatus Woesearchaeota archaeon]|nr:hypothetical protein [Candidatus Woesearchaeota archaeon]